KRLIKVVLCVSKYIFFQVSKSRLSSLLTCNWYCNHVAFLGDNYGYIALNHMFQEIVISFRGTANLFNVAEDAASVGALLQSQAVRYTVEGTSRYSQTVLNNIY